MDSLYGKIRLEEDDELQTGDDVIISFRNLHKTYLLGVDGVPALRGVSLTIKRGEFVCVFGTSGGGKSTLLNIVGTIDEKNKGDLFLCGEYIRENTPDSVLSLLRNQKIGFVFQTFNLLPSLSALQNVELPMILRGKLSASERRERAYTLLRSVEMTHRMHHKPSELSGGEQQRVTIARSIANEPELLLLDEPTGDLDSLNTAIVMKLLEKLNKKGITMVLVTHDVNLRSFGDKAIWVRDGLIQRTELITKEDRKQCRKIYKDRILADEEKKKSIQHSYENDEDIIEETRKSSYYPWLSGNIELEEKNYKVNM